MTEKGLSERKKLILKAVIESHIEMGEPVGSKYLTQYKQIAYSSATIRNEMAELEEMGYLVQPHTSAGRIPSEAGYRFYCTTATESNDLRLLDGYIRISRRLVGGYWLVNEPETLKDLFDAKKLVDEVRPTPVLPIS